MGFFGTYLYEAGNWHYDVLPARDEVWRPVRGDEPPAATEPWLLVDIHDSDITILTYRPAGPGSGTAHLGITPRSYFEEESASAPTDVDREAAGLAAWWQAARGAGPDEAVTKQAELAQFLAGDLAPEDLTDDDIEEYDFDEGAVFVDEDIFVEHRTARFLTALGLPLPEGLPTA